MFAAFYGDWYGRLFRRKVLTVLVFFLSAGILLGSSISGFAKAKRPREASYKYYTSIVVEKGDTLWSIAVENLTPEYGRIEDYILEVRRLNHLFGDGICAGEYLTIPRKGIRILLLQSKETSLRMDGRQIGIKNGDTILTSEQTSARMNCRIWQNRYPNLRIAVLPEA